MTAKSDAMVAWLFIAVMVGAATPSSAQTCGTDYTLKPGDTLAAIARTFNTTVAAIKRWNNIPQTTIRVGERLTIYTARAN